MQDSRFTRTQVSDVYIAKPGEQPVKLCNTAEAFLKSESASAGQPLTITNPTECTFTVNDFTINMRGIMQIT